MGNILDRLNFWSRQVSFWYGVRLLDDDDPIVAGIAFQIAVHQFRAAKEAAKDAGIWIP